MTGQEFFSNYWWIFPLVMFLLCAFFMRKGCGRMMCGFNSNNGSGASNTKIAGKKESSEETRLK